MNLLRTKPRETSLTPTNVLTRMRDEMDRVFDRWFDRPLDLGRPADGASWMPALDIVDGEAEVTIKAELPGIAAKDVNVFISGNMLTLSGEKDESKEEKGENFYVSERRFGSFRRTVELPQGVDADKVTAEQDNGVLTVRFPKLKIARPKQVPIQATAKA
jgi:HSP20 family protein